MKCTLWKNIRRGRTNFLTYFILYFPSLMYELSQRVIIPHQLTLRSTMSISSENWRKVLEIIGNISESLGFVTFWILIIDQKRKNIHQNLVVALRHSLVLFGSHSSTVGNKIRLNSVKIRNILKFAGFFYLYKNLSLFKNFWELVG